MGTASRMDPHELFVALNRNQLEADYETYKEDFAEPMSFEDFCVMSHNEDCADFEHPSEPEEEYVSDFELHPARPIEFFGPWRN